MNRCIDAVVLVAVAAGWMAIGCGRDPNAVEQRSATSARTRVAALPAGLFVDEAPSGGRSVADLKADKRATGEVVIHGRIGGRKQPFVDGAAVFLLADAGMKSCAELHGDACRTPWDYCCEPRESLAAKTATIQIVGADGKPLRADLAGQQGMSPLAELTIAGEVAQRDGGTLVINARTIHVKRGEE